MIGFPQTLSEWWRGRINDPRFPAQLYCKSTFFCKSRRFRRKRPICPAIRLEKDRPKKPRLYRSSKWIVHLLTEINFEPDSLSAAHSCHEEIDPAFLRLHVARCNRGS